MADSMANEPSASPGARIQPGLGMLWRIWVAQVDTLGHANAWRVPYVIRLINSSVMPIDEGGAPSNIAFPARLEIDYVRVYQRQPAAGLSTADPVFPPPR